MGRFDRFAGWTSSQVARAWFFAVCVLLVVVWLPSYFLFRSLDTWQLVINTLTTIVTFLLVALLQNTQDRDARAAHAKLDAVADALADLLHDLPTSRPDVMRRHAADLRRAVGIEEETGTS